MGETLPRELVNRLLAQAQHSPEMEVCGLIGQSEAGAYSLYPVANVASDQAHLFAMEPKGQIDAMRRMREDGEALYGIYHSHPHAPAEPSPRDTKEAAYPEALYLIISLDTKGVIQLRGFRLLAGDFAPIELVLAS